MYIPGGYMYMPGAWIHVYARWIHVYPGWIHVYPGWIHVYPGWIHVYAGWIHVYPGWLKALGHDIWSNFNNWLLFSTMCHCKLRSTQLDTHLRTFVHSRLHSSPSAR